jgi:hypothetical protein
VGVATDVAKTVSSDRAYHHADASSILTQVVRSTRLSVGDLRGGTDRVMKPHQRVTQSIVGVFAPVTLVDARRSTLAMIVVGTQAAFAAARLATKIVFVIRSIEIPRILVRHRTTNQIWSTGRIEAALRVF